MKEERKIRKIKAADTTGQKDGWKRLAMTAAALFTTAAVYTGGRQEENKMAVYHIAAEVFCEVPETAEAVWKAEEAANGAKEPEGSFHVVYQGCAAPNSVELRHCDCVYEAEGIAVYAYYLYWLGAGDISL